jgi:glycine/D-amino acid oxidase-like deaminating enzyme/nitrite reductase/ring-hydroxylating ferredoxin subunit
MTPIWNESNIETQSRQLLKNVNVDVCVIGAGITGITCAYFLAKSGKSVALIESDEIGNGATSDTTAHITWVLDDRYHRLGATFGQEYTKLIAESHRMAIDTIEKIVHEEQIDCNFEHVTGYLFASTSKKNQKLNDIYWDQELYTLRGMGFNEIHSRSMAPLESFETGPAIEFPKQAQFHPIRYIEGLCRSFQNLGGQLFTNSRVLEVRGESPVIVETDTKGIITAQSVIVATNSPINNVVTMHTKQAAYQTYVVAMRVPRYSHSYALYWDDQNPYHYVRFVSAADYDLIIVGGEDHKTGQENDSKIRFERLEKWGRERFPQAGKVEYQWCGQILEPMDGIAFIGRNPGNKNIYIATGFSGNGMTYGTISGMLLTDLIETNTHPWAEIYDPSRISIKSAGEFAKENLNVAWQMADWVKSGDVVSPEEIPNNEGAVIRDGLKMLAVYKDDRGEVFSYSAKCPHLGCVVHWNTAAKTWDCPCHGSRFNCHGEVINGPATRDLDEENNTATPLLIKKSEVQI